MVSVRHEHGETDLQFECIAQFLQQDLRASKVERAIHVFGLLGMHVGR